jgi:predicted RNA-binding Zn ribbon-like protein
VEATDELPAWELDFHFLAGRPCLDLVATIGERWRRSFERLRAPEDLSRWFVAAGLLPERVAVDERQLAAARALREAVNRVARGLQAGTAPAAADLDAINGAAAAPDLAPRLDPGLARGWAAPVTAEAALSALARDAIDLLSGPLADRVRECARPDCALLFVDTSRPGSRRWCSMGGCGNRTKTAEYRRRRREQGWTTGP